MPVRATLLQGRWNRGALAALRSLKTRLRGLVAPLARRLNQLPFLRRWLILGTLIGIIAGTGAIVFYSALTEATRLLLTDLGGYRPPSPKGEGYLQPPSGFSRPWAIPFVVGGGALVAGALVAWFAPEAEGHGTDAAISAVHNNPRGIRVRAILVKIVASAITIGSGGSGGREGPTGQISAGFGSLLARVLDLSPADARIAVSSGIGSGIGAIFGAPLGGAVLASEILYRDDFDPTALVPSFVASIVSYAIFAGVEGFAPLFGVNGYTFSHPLQLAWFALIGILGGLIGLLYAKGFYGLAGLFERLPVSRALRPAIGGLSVGLIALAVPQVLGTGYGWIQQSLGATLLHLPLWIVLVLPFARILATGLSIGSGGSGGIFGPGMVIGAFVGAAFWRLLEGHVPNVGHDPVPYVIVGMMCCFGSIARAPLAVMLMVAEMTGSLTVLAPAMAAVGIATLIVSRTDDTIYRSQPRSRAETGAGRLVVSMPLLTRVPVSEATHGTELVLSFEATAAEARAAAAAAGANGAPVVDSGGRLVGVLHLDALLGAAEESSVEPLVDQTAPSVRPELSLEAALDALSSTTLGWVPVVDAERRVIGTLRLADVTHAYRKALASAQEDLEEGAWAASVPAPTVHPGHGGTEAAGAAPSPPAATPPPGDPRPSGATARIRLEPGSPLHGQRLDEVEQQSGGVVAAIERDGKTIVPSSDTTVAAGDELAVIAAARRGDQPGGGQPGGGRAGGGRAGGDQPGGDQPGGGGRAGETAPGRHPGGLHPSDRPAVPPVGGSLPSSEQGQRGA